MSVYEARILPYLVNVAMRQGVLMARLIGGRQSENPGILRCEEVHS
jgi:hypothetical protein